LREAGNTLRLLPFALLIGPAIKETAMSTTKHPKTAVPSDADLDGNPGIGTSKGMTGIEDALLVEGENTIEGDVENDTTPQGGVDPDQRGRTNK
jgi:hypothetical protein